MREYIVKFETDTPLSELVAGTAIRAMMKTTGDCDEVIRCKDCRWFSQTTLGMTYACWHGAETVWGQTGEHAGHNCCQRIESENHYCGYGERKQTNENPEKD